MSRKIVSAILLILFAVLLINMSWTFENSTNTAKAYAYMSSALQFSNTTNYSGDLVVNGSQTLLIENCQFNITGRLIISDQAQVSIRNCTFISNWNLSEEPDVINPLSLTIYYWRTRQIIVQGNGKLNISDSNIMLLTPASISEYYSSNGAVYCHAIAAYDEAEITMTNSTLSWNGNWMESGDSGVYLYDNSSLVLSNSSISTFQQPIDDPEDYYALAGTMKNFVFALNTTAVYASDSVIDQVYANQYTNPSNTTIQLTNSTGDFIEIDGSTSYVHLTNSTIGWIMSYATAHVWLNNSTVTEIDDEDRTQGSFYSLLNSKVGTLNPYGEIRLDNSKVTSFDPQTARAVYVVWHLPLLGQVLIPYALAPYVIPILIVLILAFSATGIGLAFHFKHRRTKQTLNQSSTQQETPTQQQ